MIEKIKNNLSLIAIIFGIFASLMIFFPALSYDLEYFEFEKGMGGDTEGMMVGFTGWGVCFGTEIAGRKMLDFSLKCLGAYCLPLLGVICLFSAEIKQNKTDKQSALLCFLIGAVFLLALPFLVEGNIITMEEGFEDVFDLGIGALSGAISCVVSAVCLYFDLNNNSNKKQVF